MSQKNSGQSDSQAPSEINASEVSKSEENTSSNLKPLRLRDYNPGIAYCPLFFFSIIAALLQHYFGTVLTGTPETWLQIV